MDGRQLDGVQEEIQQSDHGASSGSVYEDLLNSQKITVQDVLDHLTGPVVSVIVHVILIVLLAMLFSGTPIQQKDQISVEVTEVEVKELQKPPEPPAPPEELLEESVDIKIDTPIVNAVSIDGPVADTVAAADAPSEVSMPDLLSVKPNNSSLKMPGLFAARGSASGRAAALKKYGADNRTEKAVLKALDWLAAHQNEDGSWGIYKDSQYAFTALAVLAYLAHGELPSSPKYGKTLLGGIKIMAAWADRMGAFIGPGGTYSHPIVAYALAESYGVTRIPKLKESMNKTMAVLIDNINSKGSYYYGYDKTARFYHVEREKITGKIPKGIQPTVRCDLSFAGWNYQALKAAYAAGCDLPGLQNAIELAVQGLRLHASSAEGGFSLGPGGKPDFAMSSLGLLCIGMLGDGDGKESKAALEWIKKNNALGIKTCSWKYNEDVHKEYSKAFTHAIYTWYYQTQALFQASKGDGPLWKNWNRAFCTTFIDEQNEDGSWLTPAEKYGAGHLDPKKVNAEWSKVPYFAEDTDLKIYATTLCVLTLEVYYRYLPTFKLDNRAKAGGDDANKDNLGLSIE